MHRIWTLSRLALSIALIALPAVAEEPQGRGTASEKPDVSSAPETAGAEKKAPSETKAPGPVGARPLVLYRPPKVGKPAESVGGGTRGRTDLAPVVFALVPDHVGRTSSSQPSLFWFVDRQLEPPIRVEFTLHADGEIEPAIEGEIPGPIVPGIHRLRLTDYGIELEPGIEYEWSVAVVLSPDDPARDVVATGWIERVDPGDLASQLKAQGPERKAQVYAEEGLWYDALTEVDARIEKGPERVWTTVRGDLLKQVGLGIAAGL
jgi:hypothetical protein